MDEKKSKVKSTLKTLGIVWVLIMLSLGGLGLLLDMENSRGTVHMEIHFAGNLILDKYDVELLIDNKSIDILRQGTKTTYDIPLSKGSHTVTFCQEGVPSVKGSAEFNVEGDMDITYSIKCHTTVIDVKQL